MGTGYIRFENGFQLCWGTVEFSSPGTQGSEVSKYVTYPRSFAYGPHIVATPTQYAGSYFSVGTNGVGTDEFAIGIKNNHSYGADTVRTVYLAVGRWK